MRFPSHGWLLLLACASSTRAQSVARWMVLPAIGSAPETGLQYGAVVMRVSRAAGAQRPTVDQAYVLFTAKHQMNASVEHDGWSGDARWRHQATVSVLDYPWPFFGIGADAPDSAEEWFTAHSIQLQAAVQRRIRGSWYALANARGLDTRIRKTEPGGVVAAGTLRGATGGRLVQPGLGVVFDARDDVLAAERGRYLQAFVAVADRVTGSDFSTTRVQVDARKFRALGGGVIAAQAFLDVHGGSPSFDQMALVGSSSVLRGYTKGRYRDRALGAAQVEWRAPLWRQLRYAVFAGIGGIGARATALSTLTLPSYGAGLRYRLWKAERSALRIDYARGRSGSSGLYIALNEAF